MLVDTKETQNNLPVLQFNRIVKRLFDLLCCAMLFPILIPILCVIGLWIKRDSQGPIFFRQLRIGKDGRPFKIIKFRTLSIDFDEQAHRDYMQQYIQGQNAEQQNGRQNFINKPPIQSKVTRVGRFLRKTSLDELPQIINVMRGEMSLIGPRPHIPAEVEAYNSWHRQRLDALPGITGLAQVKGRSELTFDELVTYDLEYIEQQNIGLDLKIALLTIPAVLSGRGTK